MFSFFETRSSPRTPAQWIRNLSKDPHKSGTLLTPNPPRIALTRWKPPPTSSPQYLEEAYDDQGPGFHKICHFLGVVEQTGSVENLSSQPNHQSCRFNHVWRETFKGIPSEPSWIQWAEVSCLESHPWRRSIFFPSKTPNSKTRLY